MNEALCAVMAILTGCLLLFFVIAGTDSHRDD